MTEYTPQPMFFNSARTACLQLRMTQASPQSTFFNDVYTAYFLYACLRQIRSLLITSAELAFSRQTLSQLYDGVSRNLYPVAGTQDSRNLYPAAKTQVSRRIESATACIQPCVGS